MVVPYLASFRWYSVWLRNRMAGLADAEAAEAAARELHLKPRDYSRTRMTSENGDAVLLSVPIAGGASAVKREPYASLRISDHGNWRHTHINALQSLYGRLPYAVHYLPRYDATLGADHAKLEGLNSVLHGFITSSLGIDSILTEAAEMLRENPARIREIAEAMPIADADSSIIGCLLRYGRETVFPLLVD